MLTSVFGHGRIESCPVSVFLALDAKLHPSWVLGNEVNRPDGKTKRCLEPHGQLNVQAVYSQQRLWIEFKQQRINRIADVICDKRLITMHC